MRDDMIQSETKVLVSGTGKVTLVPPRPDYRWVVGKGRVQHEPEFPLLPLPAPPKVPVLVSSDIADDVRIYAERREAEKRGGIRMPSWFTRELEVWGRLGR